MQVEMAAFGQLQPFTTVNYQPEADVDLDHPHRKNCQSTICAVNPYFAFATPGFYGL